MWSVLISFFLLLLKNNFLKKLFLIILIFYCVNSFSFNVIVFSKKFICDKISLLFIFLTIFMTFFLSIIKWNVSYFKNGFGINKINILLILISFFFLVDKMYLFYMFFELSMIPAFFLILGWGKNPERFSAIFYLFSYTFIGSFPFLFSLITNSKNLFSLKFFLLFNKKNFIVKKFFLFFFLFPFIVKLPLYFFHSWLPKAHVEAPTVGSMILAALLLKMGAYGIFRFSLYKSLNSKFLWNLMLGWSIVNLLFLGLMIFRLKDLKIMIAFSSINHMLLVMLAWYMFSKNNVMFCLLLKLGHGFISSKLFFSIGKFYEKSHSRNVLLKKGMKKMNTLFSFFWFSVLMAKSSAPTSISLFSEMVMISKFLTIYYLFLFFGFFFVVLGGVYCIYLYMKIFHGKNLFFKKFISFEKVFNLVSLLHLFLVFFSIFFLKNII